VNDLTTECTVLSLIDRVPTPEQLQALQQRMIDMGGDRVGPEVEHFFAHGLYGRKLLIPAGVLLMGKRQRNSNITTQIYGDIEVTTDDGPKRIAGQATFVAPGHTKRLGWTHAPTLWLTVHHTFETDLSKIEAELIEPELELLEGVVP
jgi:hypothetical protein